MALPSINDLKMWVGTLFTKDEWDFNFSQIVSWFSDGNADIVVNSVKATNGIDLDGSQIINMGEATTGTQPITLDQAMTLLNRTSYYYPFSVASGKVDSDGVAAFLQKNSDTQVTVLAGGVNPDLVCIASDGTIESVTSNTVLTVPASEGTYHIVKEKGQGISITAGASSKVTVSKKPPTSPNVGDYFLDYSGVPFKGYKYTMSGWEDTPFCYLGYVKVESDSVTATAFNYDNNHFDFNVQSLDLLYKAIIPDYSAVIAVSTTEYTYTAPSIGWISVSVSTGNSAVKNIKINNNIVGSIQNTGATYGASSVQAYVNKGDVITWDNGTSGAESIYFCPLVSN